MSSNNDNKEIKVGIEAKYNQKIAELETSLKEKSKLEEQLEQATESKVSIIDF